MKKLYFFILIIGLFLIASCQKETPLQQVEDVCTQMDNIEFMQYCYDNFDVNHDGKVSMQEAEAVQRISYRGDLSSVKGLEYFKHIKELWLKGDYLRTLDISMLKELTKLTFDSTPCYLTILDVSKNTELQYLDCQYNEHINSLDVTKNPKLQYLDCSGN